MNSENAGIGEKAGKAGPRILRRRRDGEYLQVVIGFRIVMQTSRFFIGQIVKHRFFPFRGVIFDVDPEFDSTEEWYRAIPEEVRPRKDQPFYHLLAENAETEYVAYVSEQNLLPDETGQPVRHPQIPEFFDGPEDGRYQLKQLHRN